MNNTGLYENIIVILQHIYNDKTMKERNDRLETLRLILARGESGCQDDILKELQRHGYGVTQATLSRDLRQLHAVKVPLNKGYGYILPDHPQYQRSTKPATLANYLNTSGYCDIQFSGNFAIIHTRPGYAGGLASDIDAHKHPAILGTIAGDDTILVIAAEDTMRQDLIDGLSETIPAIKREYL